jgi:hypothetical protein
VRRSYETLDAVVYRINAGADPDDTIVKVASERSVPPGHISLILAAYNTGRTTRHRVDMNDCLAAIGIHFPKHRERAIAIGEKLGFYRDDSVSKGCTSRFARIWINATMAARVEQPGVATKPQRRVPRSESVDGPAASVIMMPESSPDGFTVEGHGWWQTPGKAGPVLTAEAVSRISRRAFQAQLHTDLSAPSTSGVEAGKVCLRRGWPREAIRQPWIEFSRINTGERNC